MLVGNYALARVDRDDVAAFGLESSHWRRGDLATVQLTHELTERRRRQIHGEGLGPPRAVAQERLSGELVRESP